MQAAGFHGNASLPTGATLPAGCARSEFGLRFEGSLAG